MSADLKTVRAAIVATLRAVPGIGCVHDHERYAKSQDELARLYMADGVLHGWFVRRVRSKETSGAIGRYQELTGWRIQGYRAFSDADDETASELAWDDEIEAIRDEFRGNDNLGGAVVSTITTDGFAGDTEAAGIQLDESEPVMFAGVLCHAARMTLYTSRIF